MHSVILGLGSNISFCGMSPVKILESACCVLRNALSNFTHSSVYKTKALYVEDQDDFFNMIVRGSVPESTSPKDLLYLTQSIEALHGRERKREKRFGQRTLDIDIELFDNLKVLEKNLIIPHERIKERAFVLVPLLEILTDSADTQIREEYEVAYKNLPSQDISLYMPASDFLNF